MKHSTTVLTALLLLAVTTAAHADALKANLATGVVFEEDFESPEDYQKRWQATSGWSLMEGQIDGRKTKVLDIRGGNEGLSVRGGLADFDYEADVRILNQAGGFLFRARDADNLYMLRLVSDNKPWNRDKSATLTDSVYPHTKKNGEYSDVKLPLARRVPLRAWFRIKFAVRGNKFRVFLGESRSPDRMELVGEWEGKEPYKDGRFGFRCSGSEHLQVDNIRISTAGPLQPRLVSKPFASPRMIEPPPARSLSRPPAVRSRPTRKANTFQ